MRIEEKWYKDIQDKLIDIFYEVYYLPLLELFKEPLYNSTNDIVNAIRIGKIVIQDNKITGTFNLRISKELSKFANYNPATKTWTITKNIPDLYRAESVSANQKAKALNEKIKKQIEDIANLSKDKIKKFNFDLSHIYDQMEVELKKEYKQLGIDYKPDERLKEQLIKQYNDNMKLNIVDENDPKSKWDYEQVQRLRDMVEKNALEGYNRKKMQEQIQSEFDVSKNKAVFLARQETSLFMSTLRETRFVDSGIKIYIWMTAHDSRVVGNPSGKYPIPSEGHGNHFILNGKYCKYSDASVYADNLEDALNNRWKSRSSIGAPEVHPGREFLCRCISRPVITKR